MKRVALLCCFAVLFLCSAAGAGDKPASEPFHVHFIVVPAFMPDGMDSGPAVELFKAEVLGLTGGYTQLGRSTGGSMGGGGIQGEDNIAFLIGAKTDVSVKLKEIAQRLFGAKGVFIMAWPGTVTF
jgi:hypothetical protein